MFNFISFVIGIALGYYLAYKDRNKRIVQKQKNYTDGNIQIGSINLKGDK